MDSGWVAWFFDVLTEWGFRAAWDDLRDNYTPDLRMVFDAFVARLVTEWDLPHAQGQLSLPHDGLTVGDAPLEKLRQEYESIAQPKESTPPLKADWLEGVWANIKIPGQRHDDDEGEDWVKRDYV